MKKKIYESSRVTTQVPLSRRLRRRSKKGRNLRGHPHRRQLKKIVLEQLKKR